MKTRKICFILMLLLTTIGLLLFNSVYAADASFHLALKIEKTSYQEGDTVSVKINLSNVPDESGICGYQGKLVYDSNVLTFNNITSDNWEVMENEGRSYC